jgi:hypothetical protein
VAEEDRCPSECGIKKQYEANALFDPIGGRRMPALLFLVRNRLRKERQTQPGSLQAHIRIPVGELSASPKTRHFDPLKEFEL